MLLFLLFLLLSLLPLQLLLLLLVELSLLSLNTVHVERLADYMITVTVSCNLLVIAMLRIFVQCSFDCPHHLPWTDLCCGSLASLPLVLKQKKNQVLKLWCSKANEVLVNNSHITRQQHLHCSTH